MSKSIYDEVLEILLDSYIDPLDEDSDCYMLIDKEMKKIRNAIIKAQKQEKLLELYRELRNIEIDDFHEKYKGNSEEYFKAWNEIFEKIKELENE